MNKLMKVSASCGCHLSLFFLALLTDPLKANNQALALKTSDDSVK